jgi:hypothetical protein
VLLTTAGWHDNSKSSTSTSHLQQLFKYYLDWCTDAILLFVAALLLVALQLQVCGSPSHHHLSTAITAITISAVLSLACCPSLVTLHCFVAQCHRRQNKRVPCLIPSDV